MNKGIYTNQLPTNQTLEVNYIKTWLADNQNYFHFLINESSCRKWSKWVEDNSTHIYPCVCPIREQDCIFIETYYKLYDIQKYLKLESYFDKVNIDYENKCLSESMLLDWMKEHKLDWENLVNLESVIKITLNSEPYKTLNITINKDDFKHSFKFKELYEEIFYSNKHQNYINT